MSSDVVPCLAPVLSSIAKKQQILDEFVTRPALIQVERFLTYRTATIDENFTSPSKTAKPDDTQIIAWVMDSRCRIRVFFDVEATNRIEKATGERVTSYLRSLVYLRKYKFGILPPDTSSSSTNDFQTSRHRQRPELVLYAYDWQRDIGSRNDPIYHEEATYLLSDFTQFPADGEEGRAPPGFGTAGDEAIWRKQENAALEFVKKSWEILRPSIRLEAEPMEAAPVSAQTPHRQDLMSMLQTGMTEIQRRIFKEIKVFGINPLEELDATEIRQVLLQNGVKVLPESPEPGVTIPPVTQTIPVASPKKPLPRWKACRKSTGRRLPRPSVSPPKTVPVAPVASPPLATQAPVTQAIVNIDNIRVQTHPDEDERESVDHNQSRVSKTPSLRLVSRSKPTARKRKVVEPSSPLSPVPSSDDPDEDMRQPEDDDHPMSGTIIIDNKLEAYLVQPTSSPPLGLVTQLPVMSMETEEDDTQLSPRQPSSGVNSGDQIATQGDSILPYVGIGQTDKVVADNPQTIEESPLVVNHYLWELDDDDDGLFEVDISLEKLRTKAMKLEAQEE